MRTDICAVGQADLRWWLDLAPTLTRIFARTYAETAPHSYVVNGRLPDLTMDDYVRAGRVIRTFGESGKFYNSPSTARTAGTSTGRCVGTRQQRPMRT